jgi:DNA mismatch repair protein MutS
VADRESYTMPEMTVDDEIEILDGRHPVVEKVLGKSEFVPNDTFLDMSGNRILIITGPNMAGKSTYLRQTALIVLMAQIGSFVPAAKARIGIVDRIFTRVGASDDLAAGQSTFMVEMSEVANILRNATSRSLLILDEIGRGTSTFDGLSIAWSVIEFIRDREKMGCRTLFATHYHELTELEGKLTGIKNYCIAVKEKGEDIIFLHKIIRGGANGSYGIQVAKLAGLPELVLERAKEILSQLEDADISKKEHKIRKNKMPIKGQLDISSFITESKTRDEVIEKIKNVDVSTLTPLDALNLMYSLQQKLKTG